MVLETILIINVILRESKKSHMNVNQKILTGIALLAFIVSVCNASWEVTSFEYDGKTHDKIVISSPIWQQPDQLPWSVTSWPRHECHLFWAPIIGIWITIGVVYLGLFFLLKNTPSVLGLLNSSSKKSDNK